MRKILSVTSACVLLVAATGCLKDKNFDDNTFGIAKVDESPVGVGFPEAVNEINVTAIEAVSTPTTIKVALVNLLSDMAIDKDLEITLARDTSVSGEYNRNPDNAANQITEFSDVEATTNYKVSIPKGATFGFLSVDIPNPTGLDLTKTYCLGLRILSVSDPSIRIATNLQKVLIGVAVKNKYDGIYQVRSYTLRSGDAARTGNPAPYNMSLATVGANSVQCLSLQRWADASGVGIGYPIFTVDPASNEVTVDGDGTITLTTLGSGAGYNNKYDPATKGFTCAFTWGAGPSARLILDTFIYKGPR